MYFPMFIKNMVSVLKIMIMKNNPNSIDDENQEIK
jgi:hypothetical protein